MKTISLVTSLALVAAVAIGSSAFAQAPAGSTGQCKDGTYTQAQGKRGACRGHDGIKEWYADSKSADKSGQKEAKSSDKKATTTAAAAPAGAAPAGATGECKDGTYTQAESKRGACKGHGGVKDWYASGKKSQSKAAAAPAAAPAPAPAPAPAAAAPKSTTTASTKKGSEGMREQAAPGGGAGKVWVNTSSKVYHCSGDQWYGKTKEGEYMTEAQAKASGARPARDKTCS